MSYDIYSNVLFDTNLYRFAQESNEIEGIKDELSHVRHKKALVKFITQPEIKVVDLCTFVKTIEPRVVLRQHDYQAVYIANQQGLRGTLVTLALEDLLERIQNKQINCFQAHMEYETIHPFTDGNGRSGRALWLWQHIKHDVWPNLSFKHAFYYETFEFYRQIKDKITT